VKLGHYQICRCSDFYAVERLHYLASMTVDDLITVDPDILGGTPVFKGTRVPVRTLFEYLENDYSLEEILECFPSLSREAVRKVLERSEQALLSASQLPRVEGVALADVAGVVAAFEPAEALFGGAVGEGVGDDVTGCLALDLVVADCACRR
jgi:uncharacterized protein (DUF433 family)